jgi:hypothetical protein
MGAMIGIARLEPPLLGLWITVNPNNATVDSQLEDVPQGIQGIVYCLPAPHECASSIS